MTLKSALRAATLFGGAMLAVSPVWAQNDIVNNGQFAGLTGWTTAVSTANSAGGTCGFNGVTAPGTETLTSTPGFPPTDSNTTTVALGSVSLTAVGFRSCVLYQDVAIPAGATTAVITAETGTKLIGGLATGDTAIFIGLYPVTSVPDFQEGSLAGSVFSVQGANDAALTPRTSAPLDVSGIAGTTVRLAFINGIESTDGGAGPFVAGGNAVIGIGNVHLTVNVPVPAVTGLSPASAVTGGGGSVTISGANFTGATAVQFGSTSASFTVTNDTTIIATIPAANAGVTDVTVTTPVATSNITGADHFTYLSQAGPSLAPQTITFGSMADHLGSDLPFSVPVTASSGLPVALTVFSGPAVLSGYTLTLNGLGAVTLLASQSGSGTFQPAPSVTKTFQVNLGFPALLAVTNLASYASAPLAPNSLLAMWGTNFISGFASASPPSTQPLGGTSVSLKDANGSVWPAGIIFASFRQINILVPATVTPGAATITVTNGLGQSAPLSVTIAGITPGLFSADGSGSGPAASEALSYAPDGSVTVQQTFSCSPVGCGTQPVSVTSGNKIYLSLYGTGIRGRSDLSGVVVTIGGIAVNVLYAGPQNTYVGLDQINVELPPSLAGVGLVDVKTTVDGVAANTLKVKIQ